MTDDYKELLVKVAYQKAREAEEEKWRRENAVKEASSFSTVITNCARCGETHQEIKMVSFRRPIMTESGPAWTHWATCPTTGEPILCNIEMD